MLQSLFPKENLNTITLNPISTRKLKSEPVPDPTYSHAKPNEPDFRVWSGSRSGRVGSGRVYTPLVQEPVVPSLDNLSYPAKKT